MAKRVDVSVVQDNDPVLAWALWQRVSPRKRVPIDLAGTVIEFIVKCGPDAVEPLGVCTVTNGQIEVTGPNTLLVYVPRELLGDAKQRSYRLDLIVAGRRTTYAYGTITQKMV